MNITDLMKILASLMAGAIISLTILIMISYMSMPRGKRILQYHILLMSSSYLLVTFAIVRSVFREAYNVFDVWHFFVLTGWAFGIISLTLMFRRITKLRSQQRLHDFITKKTQP
jgi:hypothetical protein